MNITGGAEIIKTKRLLHVSSPVAVEVIQLFLDVAAEAAAVVSVQPLPHDAHTVLTLVFVKCKVLHLGGDATAPARVALIVHHNRRSRGLRDIPSGGERKVGRGKKCKMYLIYVIDSLAAHSHVVFIYNSHSCVLQSSNKQPRISLINS